MIRGIVKMAETAAKRAKLTPLSIGTHNGHFHADEALAVYMLRLLPEYQSSQLIRTRDPALLSTCHTVVDVGSEYDVRLTEHAFCKSRSNIKVNFENLDCKCSLFHAA